MIEHRVERAYVGPGYSEGYIPSAYQGWPTDENDELWKKYEGVCPRSQSILSFLIWDSFY